ncbi:MAG: GFA family protein [Acetobacteraceae bacterium]
MSVNDGGCLCGAVRYRVQGDPIRVTICHCRFCQRATGTAYMVEPIFPRDALSIIAGTPSIYSLRSAGSGKLVHIHSCSACATKLFLTFERFEDSCGVYAGTFDVPDWFPINASNARHIFVDAARHDTILPAGLPVFAQHAMANDGSPRQPVVFDQPQVAGGRGA